MENLKRFLLSVHNPYFLCPHMTLTRCRGTIVPCASKVSRACCSDNSEGHVRVFCGPNICEGRCLKVPISFLWLPEVLFFWLSLTFFAVFFGKYYFHVFSDSFLPVSVFYSKCINLYIFGRFMKNTVVGSGSWKHTFRIFSILWNGIELFEDISGSNVAKCTKALFHWKSYHPVCSISVCRDRFCLTAQCSPLGGVYKPRGQARGRGLLRWPQQLITAI